MKQENKENPGCSKKLKLLKNQKESGLTRTIRLTIDISLIALVVFSIIVLILIFLNTY
jgi:uncharacterized protein HemY